MIFLKILRYLAMIIPPLARLIQARIDQKKKEQGK